MHGCHEHRGVDAVRRVAEAGVLPRHARGRDGIAGRRPAVRVDAEPRADPLAERVPPRRRLRRQRPLEEVPERDALGGEDAAGGQVVHPRLRDVGRREPGAVALEHDHAEDREVEVVVLRDPVDVLGEARRPARAVPRPALRHLLGEADRREPRRDRPVARRLGDRPDALARDVLDRLAEHASRRAAEPGTGHALLEVRRRPRQPAPGRPPRGSRRTPRARRRRAVAEARRARRAGRARARGARARRDPATRRGPEPALRPRRATAPRSRRRPSAPRAPAGARGRRDPRAGST